MAIPEGEEITISYLEPGMNKQSINQSIYFSYYFFKQFRNFTYVGNSDEIIKLIGDFTPIKNTSNNL